MDEPTIKYQEWLQAQDLSHNTIYRYTLLFKKIKDQEINQDNIDNLIRRHNNRLTRAFLKGLKEYGEHNDLEFTYKIPKMKGRRETKPTGYLTQEECQALLENINDPKTYTLITLLLEIGCRISEALNLTQQSIDWKRDPKESVEVIGVAKGRRHFRHRITDSLAEQLATLAEGMTPKEKFWPYSVRRARYIISKLGKKILGKNLHPHMFRSTVAVRMLKEDEPIHKIRDYLGHSSVITTEKYLHQLRLDEIEKSINKGI